MNVPISLIKSLIHLFFGWLFLIVMIIRRVLAENAFSNSEIQDKTKKIKKATTELFYAVVSFILTIILIKVKVTFLGNDEIFFNRLYNNIFDLLWRLLGKR
jgi:hypothetical protein